MKLFKPVQRRKYESPDCINISIDKSVSLQLQSITDSPVPIDGPGENAEMTE